MTLDITDQEREYLLELLDNAFKETMLEENRTDRIEFKQELKKRIVLVDNLRERIRGLGHSDKVSEVGAPNH
jgi:hypothetical protein